MTDHPPVELHIVSDSTGETAARLVQALEAQFPDQEFEEIRHARVESVATRPAYRDLIPRGARRALQLADGYYEWLKPERRSSRAHAPPRQPFQSNH